jgi:hypothetical protein
MMVGATRSVLVNTTTTRPFPVDSGLPQGSVLSPTLYDIFIDGLARTLQQSNVGAVLGKDRIPGLFYADDFVLLAHSRDDLQRLLDIASTYAEQWLFQFNHSKSALVVFGLTTAAAAAASSRPFLLAGLPLPVRDSYQYLGVVFHNCGADGRRARWTMALARLFALAKGRTHQLHRIIASNTPSAVAPNVAFSLWRSLVRPLLEIGAEIWSVDISADSRAVFDRFQLSFASRTLCMPPRTNHSFLLGEMAMGPVSAHHDELAIRWFGRLCDLSNDRLLSRVFRFRLQSARAGTAARSWCFKVKAPFERYGLAEHWTSGSTGMSTDKWANAVRSAINLRVTTNWQAKTEESISLSTYVWCKSRMLVDPTLSIYTDPQPRHLKLLARSGQLPLQTYVSSLVPFHPRECRACQDGRNNKIEETIIHFLCDCDCYADLRRGMLGRIHDALAKADKLRAWAVLRSHRLSRLDFTAFLLGSRLEEFRHLSKEEREEISSDLCQIAIHRVVCNFLMLAWRQRAAAGAAYSLSFNTTGVSASLVTAVLDRSSENLAATRWFAHELVSAL